MKDSITRRLASFAMALLACVGAQAATINTTLTVNATSGALTSSPGFTATGKATFTDASIGNGTLTAKFDLTATDSSGNYTAPYTITLSGGDTITGSLKIGPAILQGSGDGSATVTGGTGAYAGVTGSFTSLAGKGSFDNSGITFTLTGAGTIFTGGSGGPAGAPTIAAGGVVNGASFQPGIVPGAWLTIKGSDLSTVTDTWEKAIVNGKLPTTLDGVSVSVGSKDAFVYFISPTQINVQAPDVGTGPVPVTVTNRNGTSAAFTATVVQQAPAFFLWPSNQVVANRLDASLAAKDGTFAGATTVAAKPGDVLTLWGTGFGPTAPPVPAGIPVPGDQVHNCSPVTITLGSTSPQVFGCALSTGFAGLYQVAIQVPGDMADGDYPIKAALNGTPSPDGVILSVKQ